MKIRSLRLRLSALMVLALIYAQPSLTGQELGRTFDQLRKGGELTIGYYGGSITVGASASKMETTSWRGLTTSWFRDHFPNAKINAFDGSLGGTGSQLGAYRCQNDLIRKHPDLVFIEFAVNDFRTPESEILRSMEGITRQIFKANPKAEIIFVYTAMKESAAPYDVDALPPVVLLHQKVADHYKLGSINVGKSLWQNVKANDGSWTKFASDEIHPTDLGFKIYGDAVAQYLEAHLNDKPLTPVQKLPPPLTANPVEFGQEIDAWTIDAPGWTKEEKTLFAYPHYLSCSQPGTSLTFSFTGTDIGILVMWAPDGGEFSYSLDGGPLTKSWAMTSGANAGSRANPIFFGNEMKAGPHTLKIVLEKPTTTIGSWMRIGAFLVNRPE